MSLPLVPSGEKAGPPCLGSHHTARLADARFLTLPTLLERCGAWQYLFCPPCAAYLPALVPLRLSTFVFLPPPSSWPFSLSPLHSKSQIQTFLEQNEGAGLQHLALKTDDIVSTMREMRAR